MTKDQLLAQARQADAKVEMARAYQRAMERTSERTNFRLGHHNNPTQYAAWIAAEARHLKTAADCRAAAEAEAS